jgi:hypothetical protein
MREEQPIRAARRKVRQVDRLGGLTPICVYCGETAIECLELHHITGSKLDADFVEVRCRNCHRKIELQRDVATDVSRPTEALDLGDGRFELLPTPDYDPENETWEVPTGLPGSLREAQWDHRGIPLGFSICSTFRVTC